MLLLHRYILLSTIYCFLYDIQKIIVETEHGDWIIILNYYPLLVAIL